MIELQTGWIRLGDLRTWPNLHLAIPRSLDDEELCPYTIDRQDQVTVTVTLPAAVQSRNIRSGFQTSNEVPLVPARRSS